MKKMILVGVMILFTPGLQAMEKAGKKPIQQDVQVMLKEMKTKQDEDKANGIPPVVTKHIKFFFPSAALMKPACSTGSSFASRFGLPITVPVKIEDVIKSLDEVKLNQGPTSLVDAENEDSSDSEDDQDSQHEAVDAAVQTTPALPYLRSYFSTDIKAAFLNCIANEEQGMRGTWYRFTLYDAAQAIVKGMKERKVKTQLVIDRDQFSTDFCSPLKLIIDNGGEIYKMNEQQPRFKKAGKYTNMHMKAMIFDKNIDGKKLLWTGSWNATAQASDRNWENVIVLDDAGAIQNYQNEFLRALLQSSLVPSAECVNDKDTDRSKNFARRMNGIPEIH